MRRLIQMKTTISNSCQYMCKDTPCAKGYGKCSLRNASHSLCEQNATSFSLWAKCHVLNEKKYHLNVCSFYFSKIVSLIYHGCTFIIPFYICWKLSFTDNYMLKLDVIRFIGGSLKDFTNVKRANIQMVFLLCQRHIAYSHCRHNVCKKSLILHQVVLAPIQSIHHQLSNTWTHHLHLFA